MTSCACFSRVRIGRCASCYSSLCPCDGRPARPRLARTGDTCVCASCSSPQPTQQGIEAAALQAKGSTVAAYPLVLFMHRSMQRGAAIKVRRIHDVVRLLASRLQKELQQLKLPHPHSRDDMPSDDRAAHLRTHAAVTGRWRGIPKRHASSSKAGSTVGALGMHAYPRPWLSTWRPRDMHASGPHQGCPHTHACPPKTRDAASSAWCISKDAQHACCGGRAAAALPHRMARQFMQCMHWEGGAHCRAFSTEWCCSGRGEGFHDGAMMTAARDHHGCAVGNVHPAYAGCAAKQIHGQTQQPNITHVMHACVEAGARRTCGSQSR